MSGPSFLLAASAVASVSVSFVSVCPVLHLSLSASVANCRYLRLDFPYHPRPKACGRVWLLAASRRGHLSCGRRGSLELVAVAVGRGLRLIMPQRRARRDSRFSIRVCPGGPHRRGR